jgi:tetratricopeptide (TPR) repeat protein
MTLLAGEADQRLEEVLRLAKLFEFDQAENLMALIGESELTNNYLRTKYFCAQEKIRARGDFEQEVKALEAGFARGDLKKIYLMKHLSGLYLFELGRWEIARSYYEKILAISPEEKNVGKKLKNLDDVVRRKHIERKIMAHQLAIEAHQARRKGEIKTALKLYQEAIQFSEAEENIWHGLVKLAQVCPSIASELSEEVIERAAAKFYRGGKNEQVKNCHNLMALRRNLSSKQDEQFQGKLRELKQRQKKQEVVTSGWIGPNKFWDGTARIPGDIVASRVTGIKLPRPAPPLSGRVVKEVKRPIKK